jgi:hypothetical protein
MHLTREGTMQRSLTRWPRGWPASQTPWLVSPTLQPLVGLLHGHALLEAATRNPKLEVGGSQTWWSAGHMARPATNTWHVTDLIESVLL